MKIILLQDIKALGKKGEIKDVAEGYAQNFLIPKKMAMIGNEAAVKNAMVKIETDKKKEMATLEEIKMMAKKIESKKIILKSKEKDGKLFGSITKKQISDELKKEDLKVLEKCIIMKEAIKKTGVYEIEIQLSGQISAKMKLEIVGE